MMILCHYSNEIKRVHALFVGFGENADAGKVFSREAPRRYRQFAVHRFISGVILYNRVEFFFVYLLL